MNANIENWETVKEANVRINGERWHLSKCAEECVELATAILQHLNKDAPKINILREIPDVEIALENLHKIFGYEDTNTG